MNKLEIYLSLKNEDKKQLLESLYIDEMKSDVEIGEILGTYSNKIRRDRLRLGIPTRTLADAQKLALKKGRAKHPTQGRERTDEEKKKIGESVSAKWAKIDDKERQRRVEIGKESWNSKTEDEKKELLQKAVKSIRESSKSGSILEKFLLHGLISAGYKVYFHKEHFVKNERLQVDLLLPELNIAIEVDGPSHQKPVWGEINFERNQKSDKQKTGLLIGQGITLIRVKQLGNISEVKKRRYLSELLETIDKIKRNELSKEIIIGDINGKTV
jgi:very-short-patch-repair endonuclease